MLVNGSVVEPSDCGFTTVAEQRRLLTPVPAQAQRRPTQAFDAHLQNARPLTM